MCVKCFVPVFAVPCLTSKACEQPKSILVTRDVGAKCLGAACLHLLKPFPGSTVGILLLYLHLLLLLIPPPHSSFPPWLEGMSIKEVTDEYIPSTPDRQVGRVLKDPPPSNTLQPTPIEQFQLQRGGRCCSGAKRYCFGHFSGLKND